MPSETQHHADVQCVECEQHIDPFAGFICKSCKRRPLCQDHGDPQQRGFCIKCANRMRRRKLNDLKGGLKSMKGFLRLLQFVFLVFAVLFVTQRLMPEVAPAFIWDNFFAKHLYVWGVLSAVGFVAIYIVYLGQKSSIKNLEFEIAGSGSLAQRIR